MSEKNLEISLLLDMYHAMLTEKQLRILELYYNEDFSLAEIAEHEKSSRQAILDNIRRGEKKLVELEARLGLLKKFQATQAAVAIILKQTNGNAEIAAALQEIQNVWEDYRGI